MKKIKLLLLIVLCVNIQSFAQKDITIGFRLGINAAKLNLDDWDSDYDGFLRRKIAPSFAIPVNVKISDKLSFQSELSYVIKGVKVVYDDDVDYRYSITSKVNYLEIPLLAKADFEIEKIIVSAYAGPSLGLALGGKLTEYEDDDGYITTNNEKITAKNSDLRTIEIGFNLGGMASYEVGPGRAFVDFRIQTGITKAFDEARSNMFGFSFGYMVPIKL